MPDRGALAPTGPGTPAYGLHGIGGMWRLVCLSSLALSACAVAFSPGTTPAPTPERFQDTDESAKREEVKEKEASGSDKSITVGMSLVVGGTPMDAGPLPKAPFPIVLVP
jgi:hypothetical protein